MMILVKKYLCKLLILVSGILFFYSTGNAQLVEVYAVVQQMKGNKTTFMDQELEVADNLLGGFGAGLNIENVNLNMALLFGSTEITSGSFNLDTEVFGFEANLDYAFFSGILSPLISAGIGSITFTDSFVAYEDLNETNFSYNLGGGIRCVFSEHFLLKALYKATWTKIKETDSSIQLDGISINLGYIF
jgi:opacity protein-like surface antigen